MLAAVPTLALIKSSKIKLTVPPEEIAKMLLYIIVDVVSSAGVHPLYEQAATPQVIVPAGQVVFQHMFFSGVYPGKHFG